jgi:hypothetical protein
MKEQLQWCMGEDVKSIKQLCLRAGFLNLLYSNATVFVVPPWYSPMYSTFVGATFEGSSLSYAGYFTGAFAFARGATSVFIRNFQSSTYTDVLFNVNNPSYSMGDQMQEMGSFSYRAPYYAITSRIRVGSSLSSEASTCVSSSATASDVSFPAPAARVYSAMSDDAQLGYWLSAPPLMRLLPSSPGPYTNYSPGTPQPSIFVAQNATTGVYVEGGQLDVVVTSGNCNVLVDNPASSPALVQIIQPPGDLIGVQVDNTASQPAQVQIVQTVGVPLGVQVDGPVTVQTTPTTGNLGVVVNNTTANTIPVGLYVLPGFEAFLQPVLMHAQDIITGDPFAVNSTLSEAGTPSFLVGGFN